MTDADAALLVEEVANLGGEIIRSIPSTLRTANEDYEALFRDADEWLKTYGQWRETGSHPFVFYKSDQEPLTAIGDRLIAAVRHVLLSDALWEEPGVDFLRDAPARQRALAASSQYLDLRGH